ncbi:MAG TPA: DegQ family serine endoprotease [Burkholderiales bacterium]|nr:DegQ family serine endoprotease [Burkholderiales bacterium]
MKQKVMVRALAAAGLATAIGVGGMQYYTPEVQARTASAPAAVQAKRAALPDFAQLVEQYGPAVVNISVVHDMKETGAVAMPDFGMGPDDPMYEFFKRFQIPQPQYGIPAQGIGSGFIVSPDGLILTNAHVVKDASEVIVKLTDRREFKAKVVGVDPQTDVAVLKVDASDLPSVKLGRASDVRVGEWVVAIGSPFGFENSVTSGIVSAKSRALPDGTSVPFIQTDVAVNPGNSGGPLFNLDGEVVGINSQIYSRSGGYQGVSFAIPIETALFVKDQIVAHGKVTRGRLGVTIQEVNQSLAQSFGLAGAHGALVSRVEPGSAAEKAGLKPGDVILKLNGAPVGSSIELSSRVSTMKPGTDAKVEVWRNGKPQEIAVRIGEAPGEKLAAAGAGAADLSGAKIGVAVRPLTQDEQKRMGVEGGLVVSQSAGAAARAGIRPGDIIVSVNGTAVKSVEQLKDAAKSRETLALLIQRDEARIFVPVQIG